MSKHDKLFRWDEEIPEEKPEVKIEDFSQERNRELAEENKKLKVTIVALESEIARMERIFDRSSERADDALMAKDAEIELLNKTIINAVTRLKWE